MEVENHENPFQNGKIFINILLAVALCWNLPILPNNTQVDGN